MRSLRTSRTAMATCHPRPLSPAGTPWGTGRSNETVTRAFGPTSGCTTKLARSSAIWWSSVRPDERSCSMSWTSLKASPFGPSWPWKTLASMSEPCGGSASKATWLLPGRCSAAYCPRRCRILPDTAWPCVRSHATKLVETIWTLCPCRRERRWSKSPMLRERDWPQPSLPEGLHHGRHHQIHHAPSRPAVRHRRLLEPFHCCWASRKGVQWSDFPVAGYPGKVFSGVFIGENAHGGRGAALHPQGNRSSVFIGENAHGSRGAALHPQGNRSSVFIGENAHGSRGVGYTYAGNALR